MHFSQKKNKSSLILISFQVPFSYVNLFLNPNPQNCFWVLKVERKSCWEWLVSPWFAYMTMFNSPKSLKMYTILFLLTTHWNSWKPISHCQSKVMTYKLKSPFKDKDLSSSFNPDWNGAEICSSVVSLEGPDVCPHIPVTSVVLNAHIHFVLEITHINHRSASSEIISKRIHICVNITQCGGKIRCIVFSFKNWILY